MLKYYVKTTEALKHLRTDKDGVVWFEYIMVAACIVGAVALRLVLEPVEVSGRY